MTQREAQLDKKSSHLLLLAENDIGYRNLLHIASSAQLDGFYYYPRIDKDLLARHAEGLICTSGCMAAEVPRLIAQGDSNQAIAEKLVITLSAVKKHTGNIYGKLSVNSRTQAVARARQLGLLAPGASLS